MLRVGVQMDKKQRLQADDSKRQQGSAIHSEIAGVAPNEKVAAQLNWEGVLVGMAAAPFLQALAAQMASNLANRISVSAEETASELYRRIVRARLGRADSGEPAPPNVEFVHLAGWTVMIEPGVPLEAVRSLDGLRASTIHDDRDGWTQNYVIAWRDDQWRFLPVADITLQGHRWNRETGQWELEQRSS